MFHSKPKSSEIISGVKIINWDQFDSRSFLHRHRRQTRREMNVRVKKQFLKLSENFHVSVNSPANTADCTRGAGASWDYHAHTHTFERPQREPIRRVFRSFLEVSPARRCVCGRKFSIVHGRDRRIGMNHGENGGGLYRFGVCIVLCVWRYVHMSTRTFIMGIVKY